MKESVEKKGRSAEPRGDPGCDIFRLHVIAQLFLASRQPSSSSRATPGSNTNANVRALAMHEAIIIANWPSCLNSLAWSHDCILALAAGETVELLVSTALHFPRPLG